VTHPTWRHRSLSGSEQQYGNVVTRERVSMACKTKPKAGLTLSRQAIKLVLPVRRPIGRRVRSGARTRGIIRLLLDMYSRRYITCITTACMTVLVSRIWQPRPAGTRKSDMAICDL
jgi:hypothetical protein